MPACGVGPSGESVSPCGSGNYMGRALRLNRRHAGCVGPCPPLPEKTAQPLSHFFREPYVQYGQKLSDAVPSGLGLGSEGQQEIGKK
jgi:hypothetical protein